MPRQVQEANNVAKISKYSSSNKKRGKKDMLIRKGHVMTDTEAGCSHRPKNTMNNQKLGCIYSPRPFRENMALLTPCF